LVVVGGVLMCSVAVRRECDENHWERSARGGAACALACCAVRGSGEQQSVRDGEMGRVGVGQDRGSSGGVIVRRGGAEYVEGESSGARNLSCAAPPFYNHVNGAAPRQAPGRIVRFSGAPTDAVDNRMSRRTSVGLFVSVTRSCGVDYACCFLEQALLLLLVFRCCQEQLNQVIGRA